MKIESVRLIHAQGVPNHYVANQIYQPLDEDHRKRGSFAILLNHADTTQGAFIASLINTLIREYYRNHTTDLLTSFEQTLVRLNEQIRQYTRSRDTIGSINGVIALISGEEVHLTHIGSPLAYLSRGSDLVELVEASPLKEGDIPSFSVITSGEIQTEDVIVLITNLGSSEGLKGDIPFSLMQSPLFEAGRAFARIKRQQGERAFESVFIRFNQESEETTQVYIDRSLETTTEKLDNAKKVAAIHTSFFITGLKVVGESVTKTKLLKLKSKVTETNDATFLETEESHQVMTEEADTDIEPHVTSAPHLQTSPSTPHTNESGFQVHTYWQGKSAPTPLQELEEAGAALQTTRPPLLVSRSQLWNRVNTRTLYLLLGCLAVLGLSVKIVNTVLKHTPDTSQAIAERDAFITQAEEAARKAEAALVSDDNASAISNLIAAQGFIAKINDKNQTETSRSIATRASEKIDALTKTTQLTQTKATQSLPASGKQVVTTANGSYVLTHDNTLFKYTDTGLKPITSLPAGFKLTEAVPYENFQKLALYGTTSDAIPTVLSIVTVTDEMSTVARNDGQPWPVTKHIASFEANLYFVGDTMSKAIPKDGAFRVIPYANNESTKNVTSIINNGFAFYALEDSKNLVRIAANTANTPVKLYGVPDGFLPVATNRLISTRKDGSLYLLDTSGQRILEVSTDGAYRQQFKLPKNDTFTDCDATEKEFICTTVKKEIKTLPFS